MKRRAMLSVLPLVIATALLAQDKKTDSKSSEDLVADGIKQFHERMLSPQSNIREKEFDAVMADRKVLEALFGDDARLVWPRFEQSLKVMRTNTDKMKDEFDRSGTIKSVEVIDVRKQRSPPYERVLQLIPKNVPVYRAAITYENRSAGSGSYVVIDGRMRMVRGLEGIPEIIDREKGAKK